MLTAVISLSTALTLVIAALAVSELRRRRTKREVARLESRLRATRDPRRSGGSATMRAMVGSALGTAAKVREVGVTGAVRSSLENMLRWSLESQSELDALVGPDGTVTIAFSDIEDSTVLNDELGDTIWMRILESHDKVVRSAVQKHGGHIVKSQGDGFMLAFGDPLNAVRGALAMQAAIEKGDRHLRRTPLRVRVGIHVGTAKERDGDLFGRDVAFAARVTAQAFGSEVLVSDDVRNAISDAPDLAFTDPRVVELKGLPGEHQLWLATSARPGELQ